MGLFFPEDRETFVELMSSRDPWRDPAPSVSIVAMGYEAIL